MSVRFAQEPFGEHDLDDVGHRLFARPVALELAGERDPADRLTASLRDPLEAGAVGLVGCSPDRVDDGIDVVALPSARRGRGTPGRSPSRVRTGSASAVRCAHRGEKVGVLPRVEARPVDRRVVVEQLGELRHGRLLASRCDVDRRVDDRQHRTPSRSSRSRRCSRAAGPDPSSEPRRTATADSRSPRARRSAA